MAAAYPHKSVTVARKRLTDSSPLHSSALLRDEEIVSFSRKRNDLLLNEHNPGRHSPSQGFSYLKSLPRYGPGRA
jgi:hypothetical protein